MYKNNKVPIKIRYKDLNWCCDNLPHHTQFSFRDLTLFLAFNSISVVLNDIQNIYGQKSGAKALSKSYIRNLWWKKIFHRDIASCFVLSVWAWISDATLVIFCSDVYIFIHGENAGWGGCTEVDLHNGIGFNKYSQCPQSAWHEILF